jgi:hypothetical protein
LGLDDNYKKDIMRLWSLPIFAHFYLFFT